MTPTIFVNIAAYKEPELVPTLKDLYAKADNPDSIFVGLCYQDRTPIDFTAIHKNIKWFDILPEESKGACWARNTANVLYNGQDYYFQIDSHSRLTEGWDTKIIATYEELANKDNTDKIILSQHPTPYHKIKVSGNLVTPEKIEDGYVFGTELFDITDAGIPLFRAKWLDKKPVEPELNVCVSAACFFTAGNFVEEVNIDPDIYFYGEEFDMAIRAWTRGYNIYTLHYNLVFHDYDRNHLPKHWGDNPHWGEYDLKAIGQINKKLVGELKGQFGLGGQRTLAQYEFVAKMSLANKTINGVPVKLNRIQNAPKKAEAEELNLALEIPMQEFRKPTTMFIDVKVKSKEGAVVGITRFTSANKEFFADDLRYPMTLSLAQIPNNYDVVAQDLDGTKVEKNYSFTLTHVEGKVFLQGSSNCNCGK